MARASGSANCRRAALPDRRGASSLEFALIGIPLMLVVLSGMELARYSATIASMRAVLDDAARAATLAGYANLIADRAACTGLASGTSMMPAPGQTFLVDRDRLELAVDSCTTSGAVTTVRLTARYHHSFLFALLSQFSGTFTETATASFN